MHATDADFDIIHTLVLQVFMKDLDWLRRGPMRFLERYIVSLCWPNTDVVDCVSYRFMHEYMCMRRVSSTRVLPVIVVASCSRCNVNECVRCQHNDSAYCTVCVEHPGAGVVP